jgi:membrane protein DedA with SNARE-associated domain
MSKKDQKKKQLSTFFQFTGMAFQMGGTIYLGSLLGSWLDVKFENENQLYFKVLTLVAVFLAMYTVIRKVHKIGGN